MLTKEQIVFWLTKMTELDLAQDSNKQRIVDTFVNSIYVHEDKAVINLNCREGEEIVPFEAESGSFLSRFRELIRHNPNTIMKNVLKRRNTVLFKNTVEHLVENGTISTAK